MSERGTETPTGATRALMKGIEMTNSTKVTVPQDAIDAILKANLSETNSVGAASVEFYEAALTQVGIDPESLSFAEAVEVTRRLYAISADFRRDRAEVAKAAREAERAEARKKREAAKAKRELEEVEILKAKLAAKGISV